MYSPVFAALGSPTEKRRMRGWPVLRLMENLRFTNAPTWLMALDMVGNLVVVEIDGGKGAKRERAESFWGWLYSRRSVNS